MLVSVAFGNVSGAVGLAGREISEEEGGFSL